jgi:hypothetical protein
MESLPDDLVAEIMMTEYHRPDDAKDKSSSS